MTDKQIIIDGVDVSGCPHYIHKDGSCSSQDCECIKCIHNVCFYKDYKAKEQECEGLKKELAKVYEDIKLSPLCYKCDEEECLRKEINQLKAENDTLFKAIEEVNKINKRLESKNKKFKEFSKLLEEQMKFNKSELELSLSSEIKRSDLLLKEFKKADKQRDNWREKANKLKQALTEIKEIAEEKANVNDWLALEILQKCEVLDD